MKEPHYRSMIIRNFQRVYTDENGTEYILDELGNKMPPMQSAMTKPGNYFAPYDDTQGHCALCGILTCKGTCIK